MNTTFKKLCLAAALTAGSSAVVAAPINVGGVVWDPDDDGSTFGFGDPDYNAGTASLMENTALFTDDQIQGVGTIDAVNSTGDENVFCPSCDLAYIFGGYTLLDKNPGNNDPFNLDPSVGNTDIGIDLTGVFNGGDSEFAFTGGWLQVYVLNDGDYVAGALSNTLVDTILTGTLWLDLQAVDSNQSAVGETLTGTVGNFDPTEGLSGEGAGYFNVVGGLAANNFDTNGELGGTDFTFTSSFQPRNGGAYTDGGLNPFVYTHSGSGEITGDSIPEPGTIALFGLSLLSLAVIRRKMKV